MTRILARRLDRGHLVLVLADQGLVNLDFGSGIAQSTMDPASPQRLCLAYTRRMMLALAFPRNPLRFLILGLGGASIPRFLLHHYPHCRIDAVELSPVVVEMARRFFLLPDDPRIAILVQDAVDFVAVAVGPYEAIFIDLFDPEAMAAPLFNDHFYAACHALLAPDGVLCVNLWSGDRRRHRLALDALNSGLPRPPLLLPVAQRSNVIALSPAAEDGPGILEEAVLRSEALAGSLGLPLPRYLTELRHVSPWSVVLQQLLARFVPGS
ncbi:MAG: hypothetical protein BWK76_17635 [Desulfobulbaceae bacterium A2]|nr:MAG: hypothetical protein BWK76_17635 [Desulfobulbaceae bacterium A2]